MKNPVLLFMILCICTNLKAQKIQILETERLIEIQDTAYILDSVIYYKYPSEVDSVCYRKYIYHRQQDGRIVYSEQFSYDAVWQSWLNENRTSYYWDSAGVDYLYINYRWSKTDQDWRPFSRVDIELDEFGATLLRHYQDWDTINNKWINNYKRFFEYDENRNLILEGQINWNKEENIWKTGNRYEREYNDKKQMIMESRYRYDPFYPKWVGYYKYVMEYNEDKLISEIYFNWIDWEDRWIEAQKNEYHYDESDQVILTNQYQWLDESWTLQNQDSTIYLNSEEKNWNLKLTRISITLPWDSVERTEIIFDEVSGNTETNLYQYTGNNWQIMSKTIRGVDVNGSSYFEGYFWDTELQQLTGTYISETRYNDKGIYLGQTIYVWPADYNNWIGTFNVSYNRYDFGLINYESYFKWDTINSEWDIDEKGFYYYNMVIYSDNKPKMVPADEIFIYPNPAQDVLNISIAGEPAGINSYYIYDLTGKMIISGQLEENSTMIDVSGLKNGLYIIKVQGSAKYTTKIVIRK